MASTRKPEAPATPRSRPASTPEGREKQLIALAFDEAERQLRDGSASSQIITQLMKAGTVRERLEQERLMREVDLLQKKAEGMESAQRVEQLYDDAITAMRKYQGQEPIETYDD